MTTLIGPPSEVAFSLCCERFKCLCEPFLDLPSGWSSSLALVKLIRLRFSSLVPRELVIAPTLREGQSSFVTLRKACASVTGKG
jgi:hypothetical protein